jgi:hypothetical protein
MAADAASDLAFLAATAHRSIGDLRRAVDAVPVDPGRRGAAFRSVIDAVLGALETGVGEQEKKFAAAADEHEQRAAVREMRRVNLIAMSLHEVTPWIESARAATVRLGLVYLVDEMVAGILKQPADVVITPSGTYNYSTIHKPFAELLNNLAVPYPAGVAPVIVTYPVHEPDSLFLHLIIAHELGHSAVTEQKLDQEVLKQDPNQAATAAILGPAVAEYVAVMGGTNAAARGSLRAILSNWLTEILCDGVALAFLGPSFVFTATAFSKPFGGPEPFETHPPFTLRMKLLIERLDAWGWRNAVEEAAPEIFTWIEDLANQDQQPGRHQYFLRLEEAINQLAPVIHQLVEDQVSTDRFAHAGHAPLADQLATLLEHSILPAQLLDRTAAPLRSIVFAGWVHALAVHGDEPVKLAEAVGDRDQQRFLTKALEMSAILDRWEKLT